MAKGFHDERYRDTIAKLVAVRKSQKLSQAALAELLGQHQQFVSRYETGERRLDVVEYFDIATALNADPFDLLRGLHRTAKT